MPVLALNKEVELVVTWVCQWHCEYCSVDTHNRPVLTMDMVREKLKQLPHPDYTITLSGGEVGTMKRQDIEEIISTVESLGNKLTINTNGLFIKRYPDLLKHFDTILYHCSEDLEPTDEIILDPVPNLEYLLIVTDNNYHKLDAFLNKYPNINFSLVAATNPKGINNVTLGAKLKHQMLTRYHNRMTKDSVKRIFKEKDFDSIIYI